VIDGDVSGQLSGVQFPKATRYPMPQLSAPGQMMLDVAGNKADIVIADPSTMEDYFASNPGTLRKVPTGGPIAIIPNTFSVLRGDEGTALVDLLNQGMENVKYTGLEKQILAKYEKGGDLGFYPTAKPYEVPK
jgi:ABC-type amino acid transport substrate-binding protein